MNVDGSPLVTVSELCTLDVRCLLCSWRRRNSGCRQW